MKRAKITGLVLEAGVFDAVVMGLTPPRLMQFSGSRAQAGREGLTRKGWGVNEEKPQP